jgi:hypothetical protein
LLVYLLVELRDCACHPAMREPESSFATANGLKWSVLSRLIARDE